MTVAIPKTSETKVQTSKSERVSPASSIDIAAADEHIAPRHVDPQVLQLRAALEQIYPELMRKWSNKYIAMVLHDRKSASARDKVKTKAGKVAYDAKNYTRAYDKLLKGLEARSAFPVNLFDEPGVRELFELEQSAQFAGVDEGGHAVFVVYVQRNNPSKIHRTTRVAAAMQMAMSELAAELSMKWEGVEKVVIIYDCSHQQMHNVKFSHLKAIADINRVAYPERLEQMVVTPAPMFVRGVVKMLQPFMPEDVRKRFFVMNKTTGLKHLMATGMPNCFIPEMLGGELIETHMKTEEEFRAMLNHTYSERAAKRNAKSPSLRRSSKN